MSPFTTSAATLLASVAVLGLVPAARGHGDDMDMGIGVDTAAMNMTAEEPWQEQSYPPTYFAIEDQKAAIYAHIALMVVAWMFMLPAAVMLSLARSRYTLVVQFVFAVTNAVGLLTGCIYNANTPDLYPNNAHHKLGWVVTWAVLAQIVIGLLGHLAGTLRSEAEKPHRSSERESFIPVSTEALEEHERIDQSRFQKFFRLSHDSGQGTEPNTESLRSHSLSSDPPSPGSPLPDAEKEYDENQEDDDVEAALPAPKRRGAMYALMSKVANKFSTRTWKVMLFAYNLVDRTILILGFVALCTGIVTMGRFFEGSEIFSGLAHWIKGGVFFWLGILTIGRWAGSFGELGWAWNIRPRTVGQKWRPSAEFVESALIFGYGSTNIFLEHLGGWGGEYTAQDLEHISITVLFIGGGLCGMLIESTRIRDLLNITVTEAAHSDAKHAYSDEEREELHPPRQYSFSMNPIPALVILLLGTMMSSHTQGSMISSMVHKQWGNLLAGASLARALTYMIMYLKPPKSVLPSRPPTELLTAFGLISGGIIFMASSSDTIKGMIHYELDAMFMYTVTMGLVGLLMAWTILLIALKGWAIRKEVGRPVSSYHTA